MEKRTKLALLILVGLLLFLLGAYLVLAPFLESRNPPQPPSLPEEVIPFTPPASSNSSPVSGGTTSTPVAPVSLGVQTLENRARALVERIGSGASGSGFLGYQDSWSEMTVNGRATLGAEQKAMRQIHPASGPLYGVSTRAVAAHAIEGAFGDLKIVIAVDAVQTEDAGTPNQPVRHTGKRVEVSFIKQTNGSYLAESLVWSDVAL